MSIQETILKQLNWRYAVKKFDASKKISASDWKVLEESLRMAPSSFGLQPWKFIVVQTSELRKQLTPLSWGQTQIEDCSHLVVLASNRTINEKHIDNYVHSMAEVRGVTTDSLAGYKAGMLGSLVTGPRSATIQFWAQRQAYIAMGFLMESAALMNIDTCPMEGLDPVGYDKVLQLDGTDFATVAVVACGYRHPEDKYQAAKKVRFDSKKVIEYK